MSNTITRAPTRFLVQRQNRWSRRRHKWWHYFHFCYSVWCTSSNSIDVIPDSAANSDSDDERACRGNDHTSTRTSPVEVLKSTSIDLEVECSESDAKQRDVIDNRNVIPIAAVQQNEPKVPTMVDNMGQWMPEH